MIINFNSKKGGLAIGNNKLTLSNIVAGSVAAIGLSLAAIIGFSSPKGKRKTEKSETKKKKRLFNLALLIPLGYKLAKSAVSKIELDKVVASVTRAAEQGEYDIEIVDAIPISSEEEVYEYIEENDL